MSKDVSLAIDSCPQCIRFNRAHAPEHPARSLSIPTIFHRVAMDLTLGLPITERGHNGILVISEYLSKFPVAYPIKSKTASEIASHLWHFMCLFGPPQELLSDQGREFVNSVVAALSTLLGIQRRLTSPYHPRTDGLVERLNKSLVDSLVKMASDHPTNWDLFLDSVLFSYRTRVHSATGLSPYELLFARPANLHYSFSDSPLDISLSLPASFQQRVEEIQHLNDALWPSTVQKIKEIQTSYRQQQDARVPNAVFIDKALEPGIVVYVKVLQQRTKFSPRYLGPYRIRSVNASGNYILVNKNNQPLKRSYPLTQLKILSSEAGEIAWKHSVDNIFSVDKILDHAKIDGKQSYLIRWKGFDEDFDSWVSESDILDPDLLSAYWAALPQLRSSP
jgi:hypothetical protein